MISSPNATVSCSKGVQILKKNRTTTKEMQGKQQYRFITPSQYTVYLVTEIPDSTSPPTKEITPDIFLYSLEEGLQFDIIMHMLFLSFTFKPFLF